MNINWDENLIGQMFGWSLSWITLTQVGVNAKGMYG